MKNQKIIGSIFGCYEIIGISEPKVQPSGQKKQMVVCKCRLCGSTHILQKDHVIHKNYQRCSNCPKETAAVDLTGQKFGQLTVLKQAENCILPSGQTKSQWVCQCSCGIICTVQASHLVSGHTKSCGCLVRNELAERRKINIIGNKYGRLTVVEGAKVINNIYKQKCICDCGNVVYVTTAQLTTGQVKSCGCMSSVAEYETEQWLKKMNITYKKQLSFEDCRNQKPLPFDFGIFNEKGNLIFVIELQGEQHYRAFTFHSESKEQKLLNLQKRQQLDKVKSDYCKANNIPLLTIKYTEFPIKEEILQKYYIQTINNSTNINYASLVKEVKDSHKTYKTCGFYQIDLEKRKILKKWNSLREIVSELGFIDSGILDCCSKRLKTYKGFGWAYAEDSFNLEEYLAFCTAPDKTASKAVIQFTKDTHEFIRQWNTATEAATYCNIKAHSITSCCRGAQKSAGGYYWEYLN